ncbi:MAG: prolipoprotein diacylglyceryl transferase [Ignavibacteriae bacterium HGW-Ignavibacteriae-3]|nr:MAG: prolipoprotein diacylglyceryl transferase [Ignavibacteriae bacterium HGW-Ignavibacteriae-3]
MVYWNVSPDIFSIGPVTIRWYGLFFALSFLVGYQIMLVIFNKEKKSEQDLNDLVWVMILGTVLGARLGHCLFYNPSYYLSHPLEILQIWKGGLASHGAAIGILIALYLYVKNRKDMSYLWIFDRVVITVALAGFFIRMGNLFNSEIIGIPTDGSWGFVFTSLDMIPRHPAQLYESIANLIIFIFIYSYYFKSGGKFKEGLLFGIFLISVFSFRFLVEFLKESQAPFEVGMVLNMGQILSIPLVLLGIYLLIRKEKKVIKIN